MKKQVTNILKKSLMDFGVDLKEEEILGLLEIPPSSEMGDYSFPCFFLSKQLKKNPNLIAEEIKEGIKALPKDFEDIRVVGGYINFFLNRENFAKKIVNEILTKKDNFGKTNVGKGKKTMIEFSQPNTHKAFHVGHIRGTSFGESLARISEFCGEKVIRANYSGDTGMHVAKWIWRYKKYHSREKLKKDEIWIASIYVDAVKRLKKNDKLQREVDTINKKLETKEDKKLNGLWKKTRQFSIDSWKKIYEELNTHFDIYFFESEMEKKAKEISESLVKKRIAKLSDGAIIMDLERYNLGIWVLLRKDRTALYSAKDLALAEKKFDKFNLNNSIVVSDSSQDFHFKQLLKTLELMKFKFSDKYLHLSYGQIRLPTGKMSSRTGDNILYSDFIEEVINYAKKQIKKRESKISKNELENRALRISIAAIKYSMLKQNVNKNIVFKKEDALNFEGNTGAYLLYSYARASSILRKAKNKKIKTNFEIKNLNQSEIELVKKLSQFQEIVLNSYKNLNPSLLANYSYQLAQIFNEFYHSCPVINSKQELFRLALVQSFRHVFEDSLFLLGMNVVEKM